MIRPDPRTSWQRPQPRVGRAAGLDCVIAGEEFADDAIPMVLLPGEGGTALQQFDVLLPLLARTRQVIAIDYDVATGAAGVVSALDELLPNRVVDVVGCSLGAAVAVGIADLGRANRLVLITGWLTISERQRLFAELWEATPAPARATLMQFSTLSSAGLGDARVRDRAARDTPIDERMAAVAGRDLTGQHLGRDSLVADLTSLTARIHVPSLVVGAAEDAIVPREQTRALFAAIDDARYAEVDSGHAVVHERPIELLQLIESFGMDTASPSGAATRVRG